MYLADVYSYVDLEIGQGLNNFSEYFTGYLLILQMFPENNTGQPDIPYVRVVKNIFDFFEAPVIWFRGELQLNSS